MTVERRTQRYTEVKFNDVSVLICDRCEGETVLEPDDGSCRRGLYVNEGDCRDLCEPCANMVALDIDAVRDELNKVAGVDANGSPVGGE